MRKIWEILQKIGDLKNTKNGDNSVQIRLLNFVVDSKEPVNVKVKSLNQMYEITVDKQEISKTIDDLPFTIVELLSASDILAWILEIPKKVHKKNIKSIKQLHDRSYGAESFLDTL